MLPAVARLRISEAIHATHCRPPWRSGLFEFARRLKPLAAAYKIPIGALKPVVHAWHQKARPSAYFTETWTEFVNAWPKVKVAAGAGLLDAIIGRLSEPAMWAAEYDDGRLNHLLALCAELARALNGVFYLAVRTAQRVCGYESRMAAWRAMNVLQADGWIGVAEPGTKTKATRYRLLRRPERPGIVEPPEGTR